MSKVVEQFELPLLDAMLPPRYNIAPSQQIAAVRTTRDGSARELAMLRWGLIPSWADDPSIGNRMINARAETAATKPAFRSAFRHRRCLVPADGFFEWQKSGKKKQPYYITLRDGGLFAIAGLWERWERSGEVIHSCTLLTTDANDLVRPLHDRMPVLIPPEHYARWLDREIEDPRALEDLLQPFPAEQMAAVAVSTVVNSPQNDDARCVEPLKQQDLFS